MTTFYCLRLPQPAGPVPRIYIPQEQSSPVLTPGTGFIFVASNDSQGYGGGIRPRLHTGLPYNTFLKLCYKIFKFIILNMSGFFLGGGSEAIGTAATLGLLCQPPVIVKMIVEKQMECRLVGETEVLGENLPQRHFRPSQNPT
jgi:hypothetical protein